jgi:peptidoglycan/LPS O-acetylase OafA/YrhL
MTPEQVTKRTGWVYALAGGGIACLVAAYQFAFTTPKEGAPSPEAGIFFMGLALALFIAAAVIASKLRRDGTPAATTDLSGPQGKTVVRLLVVGMIAMVASYFVGYITPTDQPLGLSLEVSLVIVMGVCLVTAGRIARKIRAATAAQGVSKK